MDTPPVPARRRLDQANAMRALAHPVRMALLELLTLNGPMTATQAAEHVDESPSNCSFHLRQLAKYGMVEEAEGDSGGGRARPWRITQTGFTTGPAGQDRDLDAAAGLLGDAVIERATQRHRQWEHGSPAEWGDLFGVSQTFWWVTQEEAAGLREEIGGLVNRYLNRLADRAERPVGARPVEFLALMHPVQEP
jgi:DNA-binding transcriptional ArsR family regulator